MKSHILVIDDEESLRFTLESFLQDEGYLVTTAESFNKAEDVLQQSLFDLVFLDTNNMTNTPKLLRPYRREGGKIVSLKLTYIEHLAAYTNYFSEFIASVVYNHPKL